MIHLVGNLDCEREWRGLPPPPAHVATRIAALATLMRGVIEADDVTVWTAVAIDPARVPSIDGLPRVHLAVGVPPAGTPALAWGATAAAIAPVPVEAITTRLDRALRRALAATPGSIDVARAVNDRRLARELDDELAGGAMTTVDAAILAAAAAASPTGAWIAKATLTAAGRDRVRGTIPLDAATQTRLERLVAAGPVVVEPWLARADEIGVPIAVASGGGEEAFAPHTLFTDAHGGFRGIDLVSPALSDAHRARLRAVSAAVRDALATRQYHGPATIDAFTHVGRDGVTRLRPVVEINARLSFGVVARALCARLGRTGLRVGAEPPPAGALVLVAPSAADPSAAWLI